MQCFGDVFEKPLTSMFLTMFFKTQNMVPTMHLTMLIAHPYLRPAQLSLGPCWTLLVVASAACHLSLPLCLYLYFLLGSYFLSSSVFVFVAPVVLLSCHLDDACGHICCLSQACGRIYCLYCLCCLWSHLLLAACGKSELAKRKLQAEHQSCCPTNLWNQYWQYFKFCWYFH